MKSIDDLDNVTYMCSSYVDNTLYSELPTAYYKQAYISKDGHLHASKKQADIDDVLYDLKIPHRIEVPYPYDSEYNKNLKKTCDFKIGDTYVEYAGMLSHPNGNIVRKYKRSLDMKANMSLKNNWDFIVLIPDTLESVYNDINKLFGGK